MKTMSSCPSSSLPPDRGVGRNRRLVALVRMGWVLALLAWTGCASPGGKFTWLRDSAADGQPRRVLVAYRPVESFGQLEADFSDRLARRLTEGLNQRGVPAEAVRLERDQLNPGDAAARVAARFRPEQVLLFGVTRLVGSSMGRFAARNDTSATLEFVLKDAQKRVLWRATGKFLALPRPEAAADQFIAELAKAKLL